jgi:hypothetical protein
LAAEPPEADPVAEPAAGVFDLAAVPAPVDEPPGLDPPDDAPALPPTAPEPVSVPDESVPASAGAAEAPASPEE